MTATRLIYPKTSVKNTGLFLTFRAYDYSAAPTPQGALPDIQNTISGSNRKVDLTASNLTDSVKGVLPTFGSGETAGSTVSAGGNSGGKDSDNTGVANISLYLPPKIEYQYGAEWSKVSFGALGAMFGTGDAGKFLGTAAGATALTGANALVKTITGTDAFQAIPKTENITLDSVIGAAFGQTFNDNTLQTFNKMQTRTFNFNYLFVARDSTEENEIRKIIKQFKVSMHPKSKDESRSNTLFLGYPHIWRIMFLDKTKMRFLTKYEILCINWSQCRLYA